MAAILTNIFNKGWLDKDRLMILAKIAIQGENDLMPGHKSFILFAFLKPCCTSDLPFSTSDIEFPKSDIEISTSDLVHSISDISFIDIGE